MAQSVKVQGAGPGAGGRLQRHHACPAGASPSHTACSGAISVQAELKGLVEQASAPCTLEVTSTAGDPPGRMASRPGLEGPKLVEPAECARPLRRVRELRPAEPEGESRLPRAPCLHLTGRLRLREARPRSRGWPGLGLEFELRSMWPPKSQLSPQPPLPVGLDQHLFFSSLLAGTALQWMAGTNCEGGGALCHVPKPYFPQTEFFRSWLLLCDLGQITPFPLWTSFSLAIKWKII